LCGKSGSGKSAIGEMMRDIIPSSEIITFAYKLKMITSIAFNESYEQFDTDKLLFPVLCKTFNRREILQKVGDVFRSFNSDIFVKILENINSNKNYIITDLRMKLNTLNLKVE
jgi:energy-coupling factor transporter ATP-binding protein EcfA2